MGDSSVPAAGGDKLTELVQAAVSASLERRSASLKPREVQELTAEARAQLEELIRRREADMQRIALLERAREKLREELAAIQGALAPAELKLEDARRAAVKSEQRAVELERAADVLMADISRKAAELDDVEGRLRGASADAERERAAAASFPDGPARGEAQDGAAQLAAQVALLEEAKALLRRDAAALGENLREREKERDAERATLREARERAEALQQESTRLAGTVQQKRGIELKVGEEWERARASVADLAGRMAALEKAEGLGPVVAELRRESERAREEGRDDRLLVAQLQAQLRELGEASARANAAAAHFRESLAAVEADRDRLDDLVRRERRLAAERQRALARRAEDAEERPPAGSDPAAWERLRAQFETRLKESAVRIAELEKEGETMRQELENARSLLARATVERQQLRVRVESMEFASVSSAAGGQTEALKADLRKAEIERDEAKRDIAALRSRLDALDSANLTHVKEKAKLEEELREKTGGGFLKRLGRAFGGE